MDIGIDLGTTFSAIAVNGRVALSEGYPDGIYLEDCDVTIVPTPEGEATFPSAVSRDETAPGGYVVGSEALMRMEEGEAPILFSKRKIGTSEALPIGEGAITAKEAAREILSYLKTCAEKALGEPVDRVVVTHPAYFERSQVEETRQAALEAGLDVSLTEQMLMEPIAAALTYTRSDKRDPLRILTYDLGGGTFDVTCLERNAGVIRVGAFDGDHLLGGYNFDRELLAWIRDQLKKKGRSVVFDESDPEDRARLAQMLRIAEAAKIELAEAPDADTPVQIRCGNLLVDTEGRRVPVSERITRREFVDSIRDPLASTVECCMRALAKAEVNPEDIDEVLLVGGSTYGPWVREALLEALPDSNVRLFHPDLCVAAGAAIHASMVLPPLVRAAHCEIALDVPATSVIEVIDVAGRVTFGNGTRPASPKVRLKVQGGPTFAPLPLEEDGHFSFSEVELVEDGTTRMAFLVEDGAGAVLVEHPFEVAHRPESTDISTVSTVLPKPLFLETLDGLVPLAEEGAFLPAECRQTLIRDNSNRTLSIRIFQDREPVGVIRVEGIPPEGGEGSEVHVEVVVTAKNELKGHARIIGRDGKVVKNEAVAISFDVAEVPQTERLVAELQELNLRCHAVLARSSNEEHKERVRKEGLPLLSKGERMLERQPFDRQEMHALLTTLKHIAKPPPDDMVPPREAFLAQLEACREGVAKMEANARTTLAQADGAPGGGSSRGTAKDLDQAAVEKAKKALKKVESLTAVIEKAEQEGLAAHEQKDRRVWAAANQGVESVLAQVRERSQQDAPGFVLCLIAAASVDRERNRLQSKARQLQQEGKLEDWIERIRGLSVTLDTLRTEVEKMDPASPTEQIRSKLGVLLMQRLEPVKTKISRLGVDTRL